MKSLAYSLLLTALAGTLYAGDEAAVDEAVTMRPLVVKGRVVEKRPFGMHPTMLGRQMTASPAFSGFLPEARKKLVWGQTIRGCRVRFKNSIVLVWRYGVLPGFNADLSKEIIDMAELDQGLRRRWCKPGGESLIEQVEELDRKHEARMQKLIDTYGWPSRILVGDDGAAAAWLIVQHCGLEFQRRCLPLMRRAAELGDASRSNLAYLEDRVRMREGRPQIYGTQFMNDQLYTLADPKGVDERRRAVGLGPLAEYVAQMRQILARPNQSLEPTATAVTPPAAQEPRQP